jgi:hypothetical protein
VKRAKKKFAKLNHLLIAVRDAARLSDAPRIRGITEN